MEPEVIENSHPSADQTSHSKSKGKRLEQKEVAYHEIIDVDMYGDSDEDVVFIGEKVRPNKKMKGAIGSNSAQGSMHRGQTSKQADLNNEGEDVSMKLGGVGPSDSSKSFVAESFFGLDDYDYNLEKDYFMALKLQNQFDIEAQSPWFPDNFQMGRNSSVKGSSSYSATNSSKNLQFPQKVHKKNHVEPEPPIKVAMNTDHPIGVDTSNAIYTVGDMFVGPVVSGNGSSSRKAKVVNRKNVLNSFKMFDIIVDFSDHHYAKKSSGMNQPPKNWAKKIQDEWRILEKDLPDTIFVRAYESRMDLLRAAIIGAEGTPYHDGLFFFDVYFPSSYPNEPPLVHYHSGGLSINPNLYDTGYVCLSLLNTWQGGPKERWIPGTSTMLQVLVSIQGLILNTKPYFNEPGYESDSGTRQGEKRSKQFNEYTRLSSLRTMVYTMRKPPKNFEDLVTGHFRKQACHILKACKAYTKGVQVGRVVRGRGVKGKKGRGVKGKKGRCSDKFKGRVASYVPTLVAAFKNIGAKVADESDEFEEFDESDEFEEFEEFDEFDKSD